MMGLRINLLFGLAILLTVKLTVPGAQASGGGAIISLSLPSEPQQIALQIATGPLANGTELTLESSDGITLGTISIYGVSKRTSTPLYHQIVVSPHEALVGKINVVGYITSPTQRPARSDELIDIRLIEF